MCVWDEEMHEYICDGAGKGRVIQPCENEIVPEREFSVPVSQVGMSQSQMAKYVALETHCLSSKPGTTIYYLGNLRDLMNFIFLIFKMGIMISFSHVFLVRIKRVEAGKSFVQRNYLVDLKYSQ